MCVCFLFSNSFLTCAMFVCVSPSNAPFPQKSSFLFSFPFNIRLKKVVQAVLIENKPLSHSP